MCLVSCARVREDDDRMWLFMATKKSAVLKLYCGIEHYSRLRFGIVLGSSGVAREGGGRDPGGNCENWVNGMQSPTTKRTQIETQ
jgi:hypothetical protein